MSVDQTFLREMLSDLGYFKDRLENDYGDQQLLVDEIAEVIQKVTKRLEETTE